MTQQDHDGSGWQRAETPIDALAIGAAGMDEGDPDDVNRPAHVRYSFEAREEGELPLSSGAEVVILNDRDPSYVFFFLHVFPMEMLIL